MTHSFDIIPDFDLHYDRFERIEELFLERLNPVLRHAFYVHQSSDLNEIEMCGVKDGIITLSFVDRNLSKRAILSELPKQYVTDGLAEVVVSTNKITWSSQYFKVRISCARLNRSGWRIRWDLYDSPKIYSQSQS
jgi:hypothetical protein